MNSLFRVSAKNHAGMILMTILAEGSDHRISNIEYRTSKDRYVSLKDVAEEMGLSVKFLEEIAAALKRARLIEGRKGPGGGYRLAKSAEDISAYDIVVALEGSISPMSCDKSICPFAEKCTSKSLWVFLHKDLIKSLKKTSLKQISNR
ncbi:Rrf2 family transcriptional regulator [Candidatus Uhrbacteria bacterium]|nr:Rrf2 family transcriptional regulator [Candidatus Uhrbacteria bacterium]